MRLKETEPVPCLIGSWETENVFPLYILFALKSKQSPFAERGAKTLGEHQH
jgi:hypothetical protein